MKKERLLAFSDGVIAIIITIMVLGINGPDGDNIKDLLPLVPKFVSYLISFIFVGIYWSNHHNMMHLVNRVSGMSLWANLNLLFWLSLIPFTTDWMGENNFTTWPVALYGFVLLMNAVSYSILFTHLTKPHHQNKELQEAVGNGIKEKLSLALYTIAIGTAFVHTWISLAIYVMVAIVWFIPDKRVEKRLET
jgi:uncharacterized membrane protein